MKYLERLKTLMFPTITRRMALDIATQAVTRSVVSEPLICHDRKPPQFRIYADLPEPCWWVVVPWGDSNAGPWLRSSRVIVIGKNTGTIHYDGSAGDEG